jgi:glycosyltransferase involved in cell wall biosynthesis
MKILYTNFHRRNGGGHVTYIMSLLKTLGAGHQLAVATPGTSRLYRYAQGVSGVRVVDMPFSSRLGPMLGEVRRLRKLLRQEKFDIVHVNASADHRHVMLACAGLTPRPKIVWTKHNDHPVTSLGHRLRARWATDQVIAVSDFVKTLLVDSPYGDMPIQVIRHGVDTDYFAPLPEEEKRAARLALLDAGTAGAGMADTDTADAGTANTDTANTDTAGAVTACANVNDPAEPLWLGSSGGTDYDKGWLDLLEAIAGLDESQRARLRVVVAGDPPDARKAGRVAELGLTRHVLFPGLVDDVRPALGACDVGFVLSYREALSYACRETMSLGLPTLVSDAGGLPENVQDGVDGWVVPAHGVAQIGRVLQDILNAPAALRRMSAAARTKSVADFSLERFAASTVDVYRCALAQSAAGQT